MTSKNPFDADEPTRPERVNPFGQADDAADEATPADAAREIERAARRIRGLRSQLGSEGLSPSATRELLDQLSAALDATVRALRAFERD